METQICIYCDTIFPQKGFFCPNCSKQVRCKSCSETLEQNAKSCIYCGTSVGNGSTANDNSTKNLVVNVIEYQETRTTRGFKASFTDTVGNSVSNAFAQIIAKGIVPPTTKPRFNKNIPVEDTSAEILDDFTNLEDKSPKIQPKIEVTSTSLEIDELQKIKRIFRFEEEKTVLIDSRLKASSKADFVKRLTLLFLYGHHLFGKSSVAREDLTKILKSAGVEDGNARYWISHNNYGSPKLVMIDCNESPQT